MGEALARGLVDAGAVAPAAITASVRTPARRAVLEAFGATVVGDAVSGGGAAAVAAASDLIVVGVKPAAVGAVLAALAPHLDPRRHLVVSIAAGVPLAALEAALPAGARVARVMPNTPCLVREGASVYAMGEAATPGDAAAVDALLSAVGLAVRLDEGQLDAATGLSGCGPAFCFLAIEALADGGVQAGLPRDMAIALAAQTMAGAAAMVLSSGAVSGSGGGGGPGGAAPATPSLAHPAILRERVCSPGGATIVGVAELEAAAVRGAFGRAVVAAARRAAELAGGK
jgi:pyrroline-5-carboxylate reductase